MILKYVYQEIKYNVLNFENEISMDWTEGVMPLLR